MSPDLAPSNMTSTAKTTSLQKGSPDARMAESAPARHVTTVILVLGWALAWGFLWSDEYADMLDEAAWAFPSLIALAALIGVIAARTVEPPARSNRRSSFAFGGTVVSLIAFAIAGGIAMNTIGSFVVPLRLDPLLVNTVILAGLFSGGALMPIAMSLPYRSTSIARRGLAVAALATAVSATILLCVSAAGVEIFGACEVAITAGAAVWSVAFAGMLLRDARHAWDEPWIRRRDDEGFSGERCWRCYYDMRQTETDVCPECGAMVLATVRETPRNIAVDQ